MRELFDGKRCASPKGAAALAKLSQTLAGRVRPSPARDNRGDLLEDAKRLRAAGRQGLHPGRDSWRRRSRRTKCSGVLAHEFGHLQNRDHLRRVIADGGIAYLFGLLFGDVTGGGAIVFVGKTLLTAANSRETEAQADAFAAQTLARLGRPAKPMGELLLRVTGKEKDGFLTILHDHPLSEDKLAKLSAADKATADPVLTDDEWKALQTICD